MTLFVFYLTLRLSILPVGKKQKRFVATFCILCVLKSSAMYVCRQSSVWGCSWRSASANLGPRSCLWGKRLGRGGAPYFELRSINYSVAWVLPPEQQLSRCSARALALPARVRAGPRRIKHRSLIRARVLRTLDAKNTAASQHQWLCHLSHFDSVKCAFNATVTISLCTTSNNFINLIYKIMSKYKYTQLLKH